MSHRANRRRLKALTALVAVAPFAAATVAPGFLHAQPQSPSPSGAINPFGLPRPSAPPKPSAPPSHARKTHKSPGQREKTERAARAREELEKERHGQVGTWGYNSDGGYTSVAFPFWRSTKTKSGGPKGGPRGEADILVKYWSPPLPGHGFYGDVTVKRTGPSPGSFKAHVLVDGKEIDSFTVEKETKRSLTTLFGKDLGGLVKAHNVRVTADIGGKSYDIFDFDLEGTAEALEKMKIAPDKSWARMPNPMTHPPKELAKEASKDQGAAPGCPPGGAASIKLPPKPKRKEVKLGSWTVEFFGSGAYAELSPEKVKIKLGGKLDGEDKVGGTAEVRIAYYATPGLRHGFNAYMAVGPVGKFDSFEAHLLADGKELGSHNIPSGNYYNWDLKEVFGDDLGRAAKVRNLRVTADIDGKSYDIFEADLEGTADLIKQMKARSDAYYAPYAEKAACEGPKPSSPKTAHKHQDPNCFITTACCEMVGLDDDCFELTTLRAFRDRVLAPTADGRRDIRLYYALAPLVLDEMRRRGEQPRLLHLYFSHILPCALGAKLGLVALPHRLYRDMMQRLVRRYQPDQLALIG